MKRRFPYRNLTDKGLPYAEAIPTPFQKGFEIMKNIQYRITQEIAVLSRSSGGYTKEINLISWNDAEPKYDIRGWAPDREKCGKGIVLNKAEAWNLLRALLNQFPSEEDSM